MSKSSEIFFDSNFFEKRKFSIEQIQQFLTSAQRDFGIASKGQDPEVIFTFSYHAFLKLGISLIAWKGYKVKSRMDHHAQIVQHFSLILNDPDIEVYGEAMRRKRNIDLYLGGSIVTEKEVADYLEFTRSLLKKTEALLQIK